MKKNGIIKKLTIFSSMITLLFVLNSSNRNKKSKDYFRLTTTITQNKIEYNKGNIYLGDKEYLSSIEDLGQNDVLVLDARNDKDPNFKIYDSYKIIDPDIREEIIEALLYYEEIYPSDWQRSKNSLLREWTVHNNMYRIGYKKHRTTDVDLNNADEKTYLIKK